MRPIRVWFLRTFNNPQLVLLLALLAGFFLVMTFFAGIIAPLIAGVVLAFLLDKPAEWLKRRGFPNWAAATIMFVGFVAFLAILLMLVLPPLIQQTAAFVRQVPQMIGELRTELSDLPQAYPDLVTEAQLARLFSEIEALVPGLGRQALFLTLDSVTTLIVAFIYTLLTLILMFFFLKDKRQIMAWLAGFLPSHRPLADQVWQEATARAGDYARGKLYEIFIVGIAAWITFELVALPYPALLAVLTGLSVIIPFVGATVVCVPVAAVALFTWGVSTESLIAICAYLILQAIDGNVLVPLLFSEVVKLHPIAVIVAILVFGGIWGLWGVFFAVPLATLAQAVVRAWPRRRTVGVTQA